MQEKTEQVGNAIICGLDTLSDPEIRIPARDVELLSTFKGILRALLSGEVVLTTPDNLKSNVGGNIPPLPEDPETPDTTE